MARVGGGHGLCCIVGIVGQPVVSENWERMSQPGWKLAFQDATLQRKSLGELLDGSTDIMYASRLCTAINKYSTPKRVAIKRIVMHK